MVNVAFRRLAVALVLADIGVVVLHLAHLNAGGSIPSFLLSDRFAINRDRGLAELFGYVQTLAAAGLLVVLYRRTRQALLLAWAIVLFVVAVDDAFFVHERAGTWVAGALQIPATGGLRGSDFGELAVWAVLGTACLVGLVLAARASSARVRRANRPMVAAFCALIFFAVVVDMVHQALGAEGTSVLGLDVDATLRLIEAAGELFSMTLILLAAVALFLRAAAWNPPR